MGNLIAVGTHCGRGDEVILGKKSHVFLYEGAGVSGNKDANYLCMYIYVGN